MNAVVEAAASWAVEPGPPNLVFLLAVLTSPARWSRTAVKVARARFGGGES